MLIEILIWKGRIWNKYGQVYDRQRFRSRLLQQRRPRVDNKMRKCFKRCFHFDDLLVRGRQTEFPKRKWHLSQLGPSRSCGVLCEIDMVTNDSPHVRWDCPIKHPAKLMYINVQVGERHASHAGERVKHYMGLRSCLLHE
jgi:hypothetical protein